MVNICYPFDFDEPPLYIRFLKWQNGGIDNKKNFPTHEISQAHSGGEFFRMVEMVMLNRDDGICTSLRADQMDLTRKIKNPLNPVSPGEGRCCVRYSLFITEGTVAIQVLQQEFS